MIDTNSFKSKQKRIIIVCSCLLIVLIVAMLGGYAGARLAVKKHMAPALAQSGQGFTDKEIYQKCNPGTVAIAVAGNSPDAAVQLTSAGSGFILTKDGYVVTSSHVIAGTSSVTVVLWDGQECPAEIVGSDRQTDIAVLKIAAGRLTPLEAGDSEALVVGDYVAAIGNPLGELENSMSKGIISALSREINIDDLSMNLLQTDASVSPGNSGGPLINENGQVIGIICAKSMGSGTEGIGFAIPIHDALEIIQALIKDGYVAGRPYLGVYVQDITELMAQYYSLSVGVYVQDVEQGSAAEKSALNVGDIITGLEGTPTLTLEELRAALKAYKAGDEVKLQIVRGEEELSLTIMLGEEKTEEAALWHDDKPGLVI